MHVINNLKYFVLKNPVAGAGSGTFSWCRIAYLFIAIFAFSPVVFAQDVQFSASAPPVVSVGEQFRLTYSVNRRGQDIRLPDLGTFRLISGPSTSSSSSVQIINGEMTQTVSVTFTYFLRATETGTFTVPPATIMVGPVRHESNTVQIEVVSDSEGRSRLPDRPSPVITTGPVDISGEDIFVRIILDKRGAYLGEAVTATIKLYSKLDLTGIENVRFPSFSGFFQQEIEVPSLRSLDREVIDGEIYGTGVLRQVILFPQRSGGISVDAFEMDALVRQRTTRRGTLFDDFFGGFETQRIPVKSPTATLEVKPLPDPKPSDFSGAVGNFSLNVEVDPGKALTDDALTLRVTISGKGNLSLVGEPKVDFPPSFEIYDPGVRESIRNNAGGQEGSKTYEYLMIPRSEGNFRISPVQFSFFDPSAGSFRTVTSGETSLTVERGEGRESGPAASGYAREDIRILGSDIRYIRTGAVALRSNGKDPFGSFRFYLWFILPLVLFAALIIIRRKSIRDRTDIARMKNRRASRMARRRLKVAGRYLRDNNGQQFFEETLKALWGYLSDKLVIPVSGLNRENARAALIEKNVPENDADKLMEVTGNCEFARYSPGSSASDMEKIYSDALKTITTIEQNIRQ